MQKCWIEILQENETYILYPRYIFFFILAVLEIIRNTSQRTSQDCYTIYVVYSAISNSLCITFGGCGLSYLVSAVCSKLPSTWIYNVYNFYFTYHVNGSLHVGRGSRCCKSHPLFSVLVLLLIHHIHLRHFCNEAATHRRISVSMSVCPQITSIEPPSGCLWNYTLGSFTKIYQLACNLVDIKRKLMSIYHINYISACISNVTLNIYLR